MSLRGIVLGAQTFFPFLYDWKNNTRNFIYSKFPSFPEIELSILPDLNLGSDRPLILDVGANFGHCTLAMARVLPKASFICFEPNESTMDIAQRNLEDLGQVEFLTVGLGEEEGSFPFYVPVYNGWVFDALGSFEREDAEEWLAENMVGYNPDRLEIRESKFQVNKLDDLDLAPDFIKMDVQGFELAALRGGMETIALHKPALLIEKPHQPITDFLVAHGYKPYKYDGTSLIANDHGPINTLYLCSHHLP